jgi:hypothetical protein
METSVAFIIFNRPDVTEKSFETIRQARPPRLFVIADGPRANREGEARRCADARAVIDRVDWPCEVHKNYADTNLGCARRVSSGLDWVFSHVDRAIILEDDCIPDPTFFTFCEELLMRYENDDRIMHISGNNHQRGIRRTPYSYYFSKFPHCWGWATWKRAWSLFDFDLKLWPMMCDLKVVESLYDDSREPEYWSSKIGEVASGQVSSWAYRWQIACWANNGLSILPETNLVQNIGFGPGATHTVGGDEHLSVLASQINEIRHPPYLLRNRVADQFTFENVYCLPPPHWLLRLRGALGLRTRLRRLLGHLVDGQQKEKR